MGKPGQGAWSTSWKRWSQGPLIGDGMFIRDNMVADKKIKHRRIHEGKDGMSRDFVYI